MSVVNYFATQHEPEASSRWPLRFGRNWAQFLNQAPVSEADLNEFPGEGSRAGKTSNGSNFPVFRLRWSERHRAGELRHSRRPTLCRVRGSGREFAI